MSELKIVATIVVKKDFQEEVLKAMYKVVDETQKEAGNISYILHQDTTNPLKYIILETWKSQESIDSHNNSDHFNKFKQAIDGKLDGLAIDIIKAI